MQDPLDDLLAKIRRCRVCADELPKEPRPIVQASAASPIVIIGQAPGARAHEAGQPFLDASGDRLRDWMGLDKAAFYDRRQIAIVPMAFCYPGRAKSGTGDAAPDPRCQQQWHDPVIRGLGSVQLRLLIGQYAHRYYLGAERLPTLTETVTAWRDFAPNTLVLPHPSPRNNIWLKRNPWFEKDMVPYIRQRVSEVLCQIPE